MTVEYNFRWNYIAKIKPSSLDTLCFLEQTCHAEIEQAAQATVDGTALDWVQVHYTQDQRDKPDNKTT